MIEYDVPDRAGNGTGELIVLLTTITDPGRAAADELAAAYHQRWKEETSNEFESAWGAVPVLRPVRFPRPLAEPVMWTST